jgi:hypothetical protein
MPKYEASIYDKMKMNLKDKQYMLVKKVPKGKKLRRRSNKCHLRPTTNTEDQINAIIEAGIKEHPELEVRNPFIKRQKEILEDQKIRMLTQRRNEILKDKLDEFSNLKFTESSLHPHLSSTFNVSMPFKDSLLNANINSISQPTLSTVYAKPSKQGFMFNAEKIKKEVLDSPKLKNPKLNIKADRKRSLPKILKP